MNDDKKDDRDSPLTESRIEAAYRRMQQGLPPVPWLPRVMNLTALRRVVRRARAGIIVPENPAIPASAWADTLEQGIVLNLLEIRERRQDSAEEAAHEANDEKEVAEYNRLWTECYWIFKRMPEAADSDSDIAAQILSMKRELRACRGRSRRRRRRRRK